MGKWMISIDSFRRKETGNVMGEFFLGLSIYGEKATQPCGNHVNSGETNHNLQFLLQNKNQKFRIILQDDKKIQLK